MVLVAAAVIKAMDIMLFARQIEAYGIVNNAVLIKTAAWFLVSAEFGLGAALLLFYRPRLVIPLSAWIFFFFLGVTIYGWLSGAVDNCGCFGGVLNNSPRREALFNAVMLGIITTVWLERNRWRYVPSRPKAGFVAAACVIGLLLPLNSISYTPSPDLKRIDIASPGRMAMVGGDPVPFDRGRHILIIMGTDCGHCLDRVGDMDSLAESDGVPGVLALCRNNEDERRAFMDEFDPSFSIGEVQNKVFWDLLGDGDMPRTMLLEDGLILKAWDETVPESEEIRSLLQG